jgi:hypothetical protein
MRLLTHVSERLTARDALNHPWILKNAGQALLDAPRNSDVMRRIGTFSTANKMQQLALNILAH